MHKIFSPAVILMLISFCQSVLAQNGVQKRSAARVTLTGRVTDASTGLPLPSASIYIADLKKGTTTGADGNYVFNNLPAGNYLVEAAFVGYGSMVRNIAVTQNSNADFALTASITEVSAVTVTGSSKATSIRRNPIPIISINRQFLQQNLNTNIIDAIAKVPGINAVTTGPNISKPFIRGLGFNRILTLFDGVRQEGQQWGDEHGIEIDQNTVDRIEVVKGPASLIYGSDAVAGVINLLPPGAPAEGKIAGDISSEYQTNNGLASGSALVSGNKNGIIWSMRGSFKTATNYQNKIDGRVYGTGFRETDFSGMFGVNRSWGYSHVGISTFNDLQEIPAGSRDSASRRFTKQITEADTARPIVSQEELTSYKITPIHQRIQHYRVYTSNTFITGKGRLGVNLAYQKSIRQEFSHPQADVAGLYLLLNTASYDLKYFFPDQHGWSISTGVNGMYQENTVEKGTEFIIPSYHQFDAGPFLFIKKAYPKLEIAGGLRYDTRRFNNEALFSKTNAATGFANAVTGADTAGADNLFYGYKHTFSGISGSIGVSYRFSDKFTGKVNVGRGYRAPNISEISASGVHPGTNTFQKGNVNFKPEFNWQEDVGVNYNTPHITIDAGIFNNNIQNYIFNQKVSAGSGQTIVDTFQFAAAKAHLYGGELSVDIHPHPLDWLHFENTLSVVYDKNGGFNGSKITDSAKYLPFIPPVHFSSELRANFKKISPLLANAFLKMQLEHYADQNRVYLQFATETPTPGYSLFNSGMGADITNRKGQTLISFSLLVNNLFDVAYQAHLNRLKYFEPYPDDPRPYHGIYNMGRNFSLKVNVPFEFSAK